MPVVRIFLTTYRRPQLLRRALASLRAQTFTDWVCELHNDAPDDPAPADLALALGDPRIRVVTHERNHGPIATFNLLYNPCAEQYISLLEDDNWWEPHFLERMIEAMESHPEVSVGWANLRLWQEEADGSWIDTGRCVWPVSASASPTLFRWPSIRQAWHALHSNGAMLVRTGRHLSDLKTPLHLRFDFVEQVRERAMPHPLLLISEPLANFGATLASARPTAREGLPEHHVLLLASFFRHVRPDEATVAAIWAAVRENRVRSTDNLLLAGLYARECRPLLRHARFSEWFLFFAGQARHPRRLWQALHAATRFPELADYLDRHTRARCVATASAGV